MSTIMQDAKLRIDQLTTMLLEHNENYYVKYSPVISDQEYNALYEELEALEECYPSLIRPDSPTQTVEPKDLQAARRHLAPMYSLKNLYTRDDVIGWLMQFPRDTLIFADLKHDGLACELLYVAGILTYAITRGDGLVGIDITTHVQKIPNIPKELPPYKNVPILSITGEITISRKFLYRLNLGRRDKGQTGYANCRRAVASTINTKVPDVAALSLLEFQAYGSDVILRTCRQFSFFMNHLRQDLGFKTKASLTFPVQDLEPLFKFYQHWDEIYRDMEYDHPIDGIVLKVDDSFLWEGLGYTKKAPRFAMAFKFRENVKSAAILDIIHTVGKLGTLTPTAVIDPAMLDGSEVSRVNLVSAGNIHKHGYYKGAIVEVYKAGGTIPAFRDVINSDYSVMYQEPDQCPWCGSTPVKDGALLKCSNLDCDGVIIARLVFAVSRHALNIRSYGAISIAGLVTEENIRSLAAFLQFNYNGKQSRGPDIIFAPSDPIEVKRVRMVRVLLGLCIPSLTEANLKKLLDGSTDDRLLQQWRTIPQVLRDPIALSDAGLTNTAISKILEHSVPRHLEIEELVQL